MVPLLAFKSCNSLGSVAGLVNQGCEEQGVKFLDTKFKRKNPLIRRVFCLVGCFPTDVVEFF